MGRLYSGIRFFTLFLSVVSAVVFIPVNVPAGDVWTNLELFGGEINDIAVDPLDPDRIFAGIYLGDGLCLSNDGGSTWHGVSTGGQLQGEEDFKNHVVFAVKIAPSDPTVIWAAHSFWVERSMDEGKTWHHISNRIMQRDCSGCEGEDDDFRFCRALAVDPRDSKTVYVGTSGSDERDGGPGAVYRTEDNGATWTKVNQGNDFDYTVMDIDIDPQNPDILWLVTSSWGVGGWSGSLYRSGDRGDTWTRITTEFGGKVMVAVKPDDSNTVFAGGAGGLEKHLFKDGVWTKIWPVILPEDYPNSGCRMVHDIAFDPRNSNFVYVSWRNPYFGDFLPRLSKSSDGGKTWETQILDYEFFRLKVHPYDSNIIFGGEIYLGMYKSVDQGRDWTSINQGLNGVIVYDVKVDPREESHLVAGTLSGLYEKKDKTPWERVLPYHITSVRFDPGDSLTIYAGLNTGWVAKTIDGGAEWNYQYIDELTGIADIAIDKNSTDTIYLAAQQKAAPGKIWKSLDGGISYSEILLGENLNGETYDFNVIAIDPLDSNRLYAGGGNFYSPRVSGDLWSSTDGGVNWTRNTLGSGDVIVNDLLIDPGDPNILYAGCGFSGGTTVPLFKSTDRGKSWAESFDGIPSFDSSHLNAVVDLESHNHDSTVVYAASHGAGVYLSPNQGGAWLNLGTPEHLVFSIATGSLYAGGQGGLIQCTGTGVIAGSITDRISNGPVDKAAVFNDLGVNSRSVNGEYMVVSPAGITDLTVIAHNHANTSVGKVEVYGGDVARVDVAMERGVSDSSLEPGNTVRNGSGGCFVTALNSGFPGAQGQGLSIKWVLLGSVLLVCCFAFKKLQKPAAGGGLCLSTVRIIYMKLASNRQAETGVTLLSFSQPVRGLLRGKWQLFRRPCRPLPFNPFRATPVPARLLISSFMLRCAAYSVKPKLELLIIIALGFGVLVFAATSSAGTLWGQVGVSSTPNPVGSGARALGMGGAFIGVADDATAASWNPAGLIQLEEKEVSLVGDASFQRETFSSMDHPELSNTGKTDFSDLNYFSLAYPFHYGQNLVVAVNYQRLYDFNRSFDYRLDLGAAGLDLAQIKNYSQEGSIGALGIALAVEITPRLSMGMTVNAWTDRLLWENGWTESYSEQSTGSLSGVQVTMDTRIEDRYSDFSGINANIGLLWDIGSGVALGMVLKTPFTATFDHDFSYSQDQILSDPVNDTIKSSYNLKEVAELHMPASFGLGIAWRISDALTLAFDVYQTLWNDYYFEDGLGQRFSPIDGRLKQDSDVDDTTQLRWGAEYLFVMTEKEWVVPLRAGFFYDPEPCEGNVKEFYGITLGTGLARKKVVFDLAYRMRWGNDVDTGNLIHSSTADIQRHTVLASLIYHF